MSFTVRHDYEHTPAPRHYSPSVWTNSVRNRSPAGSRTAIGKMQRTDTHVCRKLLWLDAGKGQHVAHLINACVILYMNVIFMGLSKLTCMPRLDRITWNWSMSFLCSGRMSCGTNFSCTAKPYSRICACDRESGSRRVLESGQTRTRS